MDILKSMSKLKDLELDIDLDLMIQPSHSSKTGEMLVRDFLHDFEEERMSNPAWQCSQVSILGRNKDVDIHRDLLINITSHCKLVILYYIADVHRGGMKNTVLE